MGNPLHVILVIAFWLAGEAVVEVIRPPLDKLLAPLGRALRSPVGGRVLLMVWLASAQSFWLGWRMGTTVGDEWRVVAAVVLVFGSAVLALCSTLVWRRRNDPPRPSPHRTS